MDLGILICITGVLFGILCTLIGTLGGLEKKLEDIARELRKLNNKTKK